jgi:hypothetical protein
MNESEPKITISRTKQKAMVAIILQESARIYKTETISNKTSN